METDESFEEESSTDDRGSDSDLIQLTFEESRVLGCLLEKEATTPDHYPLTLNSLHSACNQSSNRDPVTDLGTDTVEEAMEGLRYKQLGVLVHQAGARVPKCKHTFDNKFPYLTKGQQAILCVLFLRGQQTAGELRQRTERMHPFVDVEKVQSTLDGLASYEPEPLVKLIPAGGGRRVATYVHLFCGDVVSAPISSDVVAPVHVSDASSWREELEEEVASLKEQVAGLRAELEELKTNLGV
ncbi:MAG: YceH family protein [Verrucomicrobiales bacterium]|nr:YceH family protein [Verrucomicrobiales bacterium]